MGQYYKLVNLSKKEYINPQELDGHDAKACEVLMRGSAVGQVLLMLLTNHPEHRGGGDIKIVGPLKEVMGRWIGDEVIVAGDYIKDKDYFPRDGTRVSLIKQECENDVFKNIIDMVGPALTELNRQIDPNPEEYEELDTVEEGDIITVTYRRVKNET